MPEVFLALRRSFATLGRGRVWLYMLGPAIFALLIMIGLSFVLLERLIASFVAQPPISWIAAWGAFWLANFTRTTRPYPFGLPAEAMPERFLRKHNTWSPIFGQTQYADPKGMGRLVFAE